MHKRIITFFILFLFIPYVYPFWIWSPKTGKWRNPKYSPQVSPFLQFKEGEKYFNEKRYKESYVAFKKVVIHYPDAEVAAEAQYYLGRCLEELKQLYQAFLEYQKVIDSYPNSKRVNEIVERQYKIGEYFLNVAPKQWLGISIYDFVEHPSIEIFKKIVEKVPYSSYAPIAQYKLGLLFLHLRRYEEAMEVFQKLIDNYPESEWSAPAKYQLAIATSKTFAGVGYDSSSLIEARQRLDEFIKKYPDMEISSQAKEHLKDLREREAKKNFDIAHFYEKQKKYDSSLVYYNLIVDEYLDTKYYKLAKDRIKYIKDFLKKDKESAKTIDKKE